MTKLPLAAFNFIISAFTPIMVTAASQIVACGDKTEFCGDFFDAWAIKSSNALNCI
jgi:hypothetical protein